MEDSTDCQFNKDVIGTNRPTGFEALPLQGALQDSEDPALFQPENADVLPEIPRTPKRVLELGIEGGSQQTHKNEVHEIGRFHPMHLNS